jgi:hypothetical protein
MEMEMLSIGVYSVLKSSLNADWLVENMNHDRTPNGCCLMVVHGQQKLKKDKTNI